MVDEFDLARYQMNASGQVTDGGSPGVFACNAKLRLSSETSPF